MLGYSNREKIWINPIVPSIGLLYFVDMVLFFVAPLGILYLCYKVLAMTDFTLTGTVIILMIMICFLFLLLFAAFIILRKYLPFKIVTNDSEIHYFGVFKKNISKWNDIQSIEKVSALIGKDIFVIKTRKGNFYFPIVMKDKNKTYPKFKMGITNKWLDEQGNEKPVIAENCPLYIEIQKMMKKH